MVVVPGTASAEPRLEVASAGKLVSRMPSLRHSSDREPGYTRRKQGKGWRYLDTDGRPVTDPKLKARFDALVIPPASGLPRTTGTSSSATAGGPPPDPPWP